MDTDWEQERRDFLEDMNNSRYRYWTTSRRRIIKKIFRKEILDSTLTVKGHKLRKARAELLRLNRFEFDLNIFKIRTFVFRLRKLRKQKIENDETPSPLPSESESNDESEDDLDMRSAPRRWTIAQIKIMKKMFKKELSNPDLAVYPAKFLKTKEKLVSAGAEDVDISRIRDWLRKTRLKKTARREQGDSSESDDGDISTDSDGKEWESNYCQEKRIRWTPKMIETVKKYFAEELDNQLPVRTEKVEFYTLLLQAQGSRDVTSKKLFSWICNHRSTKPRTGEAENRYELRMTLLGMAMFEDSPNSEENPQETNETENINQDNSQVPSELTEKEGGRNGSDLLKDKIDESSVKKGKFCNPPKEQSSLEVKKRRSARLENQSKK